MARRRVLALVAALAAALAMLAVGQPRVVAAATGGSITIALATNIADGTDVHFTGCQGASCGTITLDDDVDPAVPSLITASGLGPGTYTVTERLPPNWELTDIHCTGGTVTWAPAGTRITIVLLEGQNVVCSFFNRSARLSVEVVTQPESSQDFGFTGCAGSGCGTFALDDDDRDPALPARVSATGLALGTYTITQRASATSTLDRIDCGPGAIVDLRNRQVVVTIESYSQLVYCTFYEKTQAIRVVQDTVPDGGQDVGYVGCLGSGCGRFTLDDDADATNPTAITADSIAAGTYTITQDEVPGLDLEAIACPGETVELASRRATIALTPGESITCTFSNRRTAAALDDVTQISAGFYRTCAVVGGGQVRCWGSGYPGDGSQRGTTTPATVSNPEGTGPLTDVIQVATGNVFACATLRDGHAVCWGANTQGQLGNGTTTDAARPTPVLGTDGNGPLTGVAEVSAGFARACARLTDGQVRCWGYNQDGTLGNATSGGDALRPIVVLDEAGTGPLQDVADVSVGLRHLCAALSTGQARCWGEGSWGQLGQGARVDSLVPVVVTNPAGTAPLTDVTAVSGPWDHTCASLGSGEARCWGNDEGLGVSVVPGGSTAVPVTVVDAAGAAPLTDVRSVAVGAFWSCAGVESQTATCWGENYGGYLGDGTTLNHRLPGPVLLQAGGPPLGGVVQMTTGYDHTCALLDTGEARCWGLNGSGQLGNGTTTARALPGPVIGQESG